MLSPASICAQEVDTDVQQHIGKASHRRHIAGPTLRFNLAAQDHLLRPPSQLDQTTHYDVVTSHLSQLSVVGSEVAQQSQGREDKFGGCHGCLGDWFPFEDVFQS